MRPGVVGEEAEVLRHAVLDDGKHAVVAGVAAIVDLGHGGAVTLSLGLVDERENGTVVGVGCRRARFAGGRQTGRRRKRAAGASLAVGGSRDVDGRIDRRAQPEMAVLVAEIADGHVPAMAEILLDAGGPLLHDRRLNVARDDDIERIGRER